MGNIADIFRRYVGFNCAWAQGQTKNGGDDCNPTAMLCRNSLADTSNGEEPSLYLINPVPVPVPVPVSIFVLTLAEVYY